MLYLEHLRLLLHYRDTGQAIQNGYGTERSKVFALELNGDHHLLHVLNLENAPKRRESLRIGMRPITPVIATSIQPGEHSGFAKLTLRN